MKIAYIGIDLFYPAPLWLQNAGAEIAEVFTFKTDNVTEFNTKIIAFAKENKIPYPLSRITAEDIKRLRESGVHAAVCAGYYYKIPVTEDFPIVNIHPSLLPLGRGSWPMPHAILSGAKKSGVTIHKIAEGFDTGDILMQESFYLAKDENLDTFMEKALGLLPDMLKRLVKNFDSLWRGAKKQGEGEYIAAQTEKDWTVTADMAGRSMVDKMFGDYWQKFASLRAFYGYECIYAGKNGNVMIHRGRARKGEPLGQKLPLTDGYIEIIE